MGTERIDRITALIEEVLDVGQQQDGDEHAADWGSEVDGRGYTRGGCSQVILYYPRALSVDEIDTLYQAWSRG